MAITLSQRSIIQQHYTYYISVPKIWMENHRLGKKDKVIVILDDDKNLILKPAARGENENKH